MTPASQYNKLRQMMGKEPVSIGRDQYLLTCDLGGELVDMYTKYMAGGHVLTLGGHTLKPATDKSDEERRPSPTRRWAVIWYRRRCRRAVSQLNLQTVFQQPAR